MSPVRDAFEQAYGAPLLDEDPAPPPRPAVDPGGPPIAGVAPTLPFAMRGTILTPDRRINDGYVEIAGSTITRVGAAKPAMGTPTIETGGVILPGLLDLHGHPEYNVFAAWEPPKLYANRTRWRDSDEYRLVVKEPLARLKADPSLERTLTRYAEARALVGGTTAIQGTNGKSATIDEALVRNVDRRIFGAHRARSIIDLDRTPPADRARLRAQIDAGEVDAVYVHLAEGVDSRSHDEFAELKRANLLTAATVIIHGTALTPADLDDVAAAGAKLVWSPQSNLRLYGATTPAGEAIRRGIPLALGADWQPSGSPSLLAELKIARQVLADQGAPATARQLVRMITTGAAGIAGLGANLGLLAAGRPADVLVLARRHPDPWESVVASLPADVELVTIGGDLAYGRADWISALAPAGATEPIIAWGRRMLVDTSYSVRTPASPPPRLAELRAELISRYPQVGPIFA
jgi:cytosine/adenosine deaminase-related metal-dependent hydrolase